jgi:hypothetical protein
MEIIERKFIYKIETADNLHPKTVIQRPSTLHVCIWYIKLLSKILIVNFSDWVEVAWAEGLPAALRNAALNMRAGMKDLAGEPSSLYSQVASCKYRFKNPGEGSSVGVSIKVESNTVSAGTLSSNVKNLEKASAAVDAQSKGNEGKSSTSQDPAGTSSTESAGKQEPLGTTDGGSDEHSETQGGTEDPAVPTRTQVDTSGQTEDPTKLSDTTKTAEEITNTSQTAGDTAGSSATSKDTVGGTSGTSEDTSSLSFLQTSKPSGFGGLVTFLESVRDNNVRDNSSNTTDPGSSDVTVTSTSETGAKSSAQDQTKTMTSDDEKSSEVVTSPDDKQSGMIYTMTR